MSPRTLVPRLTILIHSLVLRLFLLLRFLLSSGSQGWTVSGPGKTSPLPTPFPLGRHDKRWEGHGTEPEVGSPRRENHGF